jgi:hypothetical protein
MGNPQASPAFTDGDWYPCFNQEDQAWSVNARKGIFDHELAEVSYRGSEAMANAYLMAASKRLLTACEAGLKDLEDLDAEDDTCPSLKPMRDAIAAARGWATMRNSLCRCGAIRIRVVNMPGTSCPCGVGIDHWHCLGCKGVAHLGA